MYNGGKNGSGVYQFIINQIPPHFKYIELFMGSGAIMRHKSPALVNHGIDIDESINNKFPFPDSIDVDFYGLSWDEYFELPCIHCNKGAFIYADPPYLMATRKSKKKLYSYEFSIDDHKKLLEQLKRLECMIMISSYRNDLYDRELCGWRRVEYNAYDRTHEMRIECLYCNYPAPEELHDYRYLGKDFGERQRIRRKINRHVEKLKNLPVLERKAILGALLQYR